VGPTHAPIKRTVVRTVEPVSKRAFRVRNLRRYAADSVEVGTLEDGRLLVAQSCRWKFMVFGVRRCTLTPPDPQLKGAWFWQTLTLILVPKRVFQMQPAPLRRGGVPVPAGGQGRPGRALHGGAVQLLRAVDP
jgi:hypothetical protein